MEKTNKITTAILWALMAISVVLFAIMVSSIDDETNPGVQAVKMITMNMNWAIAMFVASSAITIVFALVQVFTDKAKAVSALVSVGILGALLVVAYFLASGSIPTFYGVEKFVADGTLNETISKWIGTGLYFTYILFGGAFLSIAGFGVSSIFKR